MTHEGNPTAAEELIFDEFHRLWYRKGFERQWQWTTWLGHRIAKFPGDLLVCQEILAQTRPDLVIETGTLNGGSALYMATVMDALDHGSVVTVDLEPQPNLPQHARIVYLTGSSTAPDVVAAVTRRAQRAERVMVILDSDHVQRHVAGELECYGPLVTPGCYLIVEDTNINGHPVYDDFGPGPMEAVLDFLPGHPEFKVDHDREKMLMTFNPNGYLLRVA